jgi:hypothetical protein
MVIQFAAIRVLRDRVGAGLVANSTKPQYTTLIVLETRPSAAPHLTANMPIWLYCSYGNYIVPRWHGAQVALDRAVISVPV